MGLRELKEAAHQQYVRGKFAECVKTYQQVLKLAPRDPNMHVRHAEACRRAGERLKAIASYREAANLLLELGCETRARGALKAALELDPHDPVLQDDVARLTPQALAQEESASAEDYARGELPLLPPLDPSMETTEPFLPTPSAVTPPHGGASRPQALPPIQKALPAVPSVPPLVPPVVLPTPGMRAAAPGARTLPPISRTRPAMTPPPLPIRDGAAAGPPRLTNSPLPPAASRPGEALAPGSAMPAHSPPVLQPVTLVPPPPPAEALLEEKRGGSSGQAAPLAPAAQPTPAARARLEVRRLSPNVLAFRNSPIDGWAVIRSNTPLEVHLVEDLENLPPELSDFSLDITVESPGESASSAVH